MFGIRFWPELTTFKNSSFRSVYRRLIWLHFFNVHTFGYNKNSYIYFFFEGKYKKGANTVCNVLNDTIRRELEIGYFNKIYLFSDGCGGQNEKYLVMNFLSLLSEKLQVEIQHLFPVGGHSYCSCERNFGMYGQKKEKIRNYRNRQRILYNYTKGQKSTIQNN